MSHYEQRCCWAGKRAQPPRLSLSSPFAQPFVSEPESCSNIHPLLGVVTAQLFSTVVYARTGVSIATATTEKLVDKTALRGRCVGWDGGGAVAYALHTQRRFLDALRDLEKLLPLKMGAKVTLHVSRCKQTHQNVRLPIPFPLRIPMLLQAGACLSFGCAPMGASSLSSNSARISCSRSNSSKQPHFGSLSCSVIETSVHPP